MAEPRKKLSRTRTHLRRSQRRSSLPSLTPCANCKEMIFPHIVCPQCGHYKGISVKSIAPTKRILAKPEEKAGDAAK